MCSVSILLRVCFNFIQYASNNVFVAHKRIVHAVEVYMLGTRISLLIVGVFLLKYCGLCLNSHLLLREDVMSVLIRTSLQVHVGFRLL